MKVLVEVVMVVVAAVTKVRYYNGGVNCCDIGGRL